MIFVFGAVVMLMAIGLLTMARYVVDHSEPSSRLRRFMQTDTMALALTTVFASSISSLASGVATDHSAAGFVKFGVAIAVIVLAIIGTGRLNRRRASSVPVGIRSAGT